MRSIDTVNRGSRSPVSKDPGSPANNFHWAYISRSLAPLFLLSLCSTNPKSVMGDHRFAYLSDRFMTYRFGKILSKAMSIGPKGTLLRRIVGSLISQPPMTSHSKVLHQIRFIPMTNYSEIVVSQTNSRRIL